MSTYSPLAAAFAQAPLAANEPIFSYRQGSPEREQLDRQLADLANDRREITLRIGGANVGSKNRSTAVMPHLHAHVLAEIHLATTEQVQKAISGACEAAKEWAQWNWVDRAAIFLKAANLLSGPRRALLNAATMLGQSKTVHQAEIDAAAELCDFFRFNVAFMSRLYADQPRSDAASWNRVDYRPLEGFVYAISPFNFTSIAGNLPSAPALMGNTVLWKPAATAAYSAHFIMELLHEAGLPDGVITLVNGSGPEISELVLSDPRLSGVHFTGSTEVFNSIWQAVGNRIGTYNTYPRLVGETGGKNFILAHRSAEIESLCAAVLRGAFEYQGQKCSAASRLFLPRSMWPRLRERLSDEIGQVRMGDIRDPANFMGAVIDQPAFNRFERVMAEIRSDSSAQIVTGGTCNDRAGFFASPTLVTTDKLDSRLLRDEFFLPITTAFIYEDSDYEEVLAAIDNGSPYALTGAIFSQERHSILLAESRLRQAAGNFYVNDKPTGAVVGQQPFGGSRRSGTNDKAGSIWNLIRWVSPRTIKENFLPARDWHYPFMEH